MSWIHIAERKVNDCTIVQYEDVDGFHEYEVTGPNEEHLGWYDNDDDAEAVTNKKITTGTGYLFPLTVDDDGNEVDYITVYCEHWRGQKPEDCKRWSLQVGENDEEWFETYDAALAAYMAR